jgi:hypothetical protein
VRTIRVHVDNNESVLKQAINKASRKFAAEARQCQPPLKGLGRRLGNWWKKLPSFWKTAAVIFILAPTLLRLPPGFSPNALVIEVKVQKDTLFQVFFDRSEGINERDSYKFYVKNEGDKYRSIRIHVPSRLERFRIDPGTSPSIVYIKSIFLIRGLITLHSWSAEEIARDFKPIKDVQSFVVQEGSLRINTSGKDPSFINVAKFSRLPVPGLHRGPFALSIFPGAS